MKNWKNDHIFRILSDPNSTEDQWLSAIDELGHKDIESKKTTRKNQPESESWEQGVLGFLAGIFVTALGFVFLLIAGFKKDMLFVGIALSVLLAICQRKSWVFSTGFNAGILLCVLCIPTLYGYWTLEERAWHSTTFICSLIAYAGWTLLTHIPQSKIKPTEQPLEVSENSKTGLSTELKKSGPPPLPLRTPASDCNIVPLSPIPNTKSNRERSSVIPLRVPGSPYLVAIENLQERPVNSAERIHQIKTPRLEEYESD